MVGLRDSTDETAYNLQAAGVRSEANRQSDEAEENLNGHVEGRDSRDAREEEDQEDQEDVETFLRRKEKEYEERGQLVRQVCEESGKDLRYGSYKGMRLRRFRWLNARELIMCFNAKVGTSTWLTYLMDVAKPGLLDNNTQDRHHLAEKYLVPPYPRASQEALDLMDKYTKIMIVRDPFARIVSAYRNKIERNKFAKIHRRIMSQFRDRSSNITAKSPTFEEFVKFIILTTPTSDDVRKKSKAMVDRHWFPFYANCGVCDLNYTIIGKGETAQEDMRYILMRFNLGKIKEKMRNQCPTSSDQEAISYFKNIPLNLTKALHERYRMDFLLFGYNVSNYLDGK